MSYLTREMCSEEDGSVVRPGEAAVCLPPPAYHQGHVKSKHEGYRQHGLEAGKAHHHTLEVPVRNTRKRNATVQGQDRGSYITMPWVRYERGKVGLRCGCEHKKMASNNGLITHKDLCLNKACGEEYVHDNNLQL